MENKTIKLLTSRYESRSDYFYFGSSNEYYCSGQFLDLETLAPIRNIETGARASHVETRELFKGIDCLHDEKDVQVFVEKLGLDK